MKITHRIFPIITWMLLPMAVSAQWLPTVERLYGNLQSFLQNVVGVLMVLAGVVFAWGVIQYFLSGPDAEKSASARQYMMYGILTLAVMISAWTFAYLFLDTFGIF